MSAQQALDAWEEAGLLDAERLRQLRAHLDTLDEPASRGLQIVAGFGGALIGLGVILFVGSNWDVMGPTARILTVMAGQLVLCACAWLALDRKLEGVATAMALAATLACGAGIFLIGQIFNFSLTFWPGAALFGACALIMGWAMQSRLQVLLAVPLLLLAIGWLGGGSGWFTDDQLEFVFGKTGIRGLLPLIGCALLAGSALLPPHALWRFASGPLIGWGALLVAVQLGIASIHFEAVQWLFRSHTGVKFWIITLVSLGVVGAAWIRLRPASPRSADLLAAATALVGGFMLLAHLVPENADIAAPILALAVLGLALYTCWVAIQIHSRGLVNGGIALAVFVILGQYFSWTAGLLDRAGGFIVTGVVLLVIATTAENRRRALISMMRT